MRLVPVRWRSHVVPCYQFRRGPGLRDRAPRPYNSPVASHGITGTRVLERGFASQTPVLARLKNLLSNLAVYGVGDVATSVVSLLLLPIYTRYLSPSDYGVLALLITIEAAAKIAFRWG